MAAPALLLFDLGGVLLEIATFDRLNALLGACEPHAALKRRWLESPAVRRFESGETPPAEFAAAFIAEWRIGLSPEAFLAEFHAWSIGFYPQARETLRELRQTHRVACFSNSNVLHWEKFGGFSDDFDVAIASHRLGALKPDDAAFVRALRLLGTEPSAVYFFDDSLPNIHAARRLGMRAFHVEGIGPLLDVLRAEGLLPS